MNMVARVALFLSVSILLVSTSATGADVPVPGKTFVVKPARVAKFVSKGTFALPVPGSAEDPTQGGAVLTIGDTGDADDMSFHLGRFGWKGLGNPAGSKGYRYRGKQDPLYADADETCREVLLRSNVVRAVCRGAVVTLAPPLLGDGAVEIALPASGPTTTYCARFGGTEKKNDAKAVRRVEAPAPAACTGPPQCGVDGFGECPEAFFCAILPPDPTYFCAPTFCGAGPGFPACGGSCANGWECNPVDAGGTGFCLCSPPAVPCDASCNGFDCPGGGVCTYDPGTLECGCASSGAPNG